MGIEFEVNNVIFFSTEGLSTVEKKNVWSFISIEYNITLFDQLNFKKGTTHSFALSIVTCYTVNDLC